MVSPCSPPSLPSALRWLVGRNSARLMPMRSPLDWLSELYGPERNPYLRLSQADRDKVGARFGMLLVVVAIMFATWWFSH
jgi:hypothetical protein